MTWLALVAVVFLDTALRPLWPSFLALDRAPPDLPLLLALYLGFRAREVDALFLAPVLGAIKDGLSAWPLGHFAFLYGAAALVAHRTRALFPVDVPLGEALGTLVVCVATAGLAFLLAALASRSGAGGALALALWGSVTSACFASAFFGLVDRTHVFRRVLARRRYDFAA